MASAQLTDTQSLILSIASQRDDGRVALPSSLKGAAGPTVLRALERRGLIRSEPIGELALRQAEMDGVSLLPFRITAAGLEAIGVVLDAAEAPALTSEDQAEIAMPEPVVDDAARRLRTEPTRPLTKRQNLITRLQSPEGATTASLIAELGWLPHTLRAALSGLRKVGHEVVSLRSASGERAYRIISSSTEAKP